MLLIAIWKTALAMCKLARLPFVPGAKMPKKYVVV